MLAVAREKLGPQVPLHLGEAQELPFPDGAFDAVLCCDSFHHYPKPDAVVQEMRRVLRPGGVCLLADPTAPPLLRQPLNVWMPRSRDGGVAPFLLSSIVRKKRPPHHQPGISCPAFCATSGCFPRKYASLRGFHRQTDAFFLLVHF